MQISIRYPGSQATDPRNTVTLREPGTPWPLRFHFLRLGDTDTEELELVNVGFEIGERFEIERGANLTFEEPPEPIDAVAVKRIAENYGRYLQLAEYALILESEGVTGAIKRLRGTRRMTARLTDDFYRLVADDYEAHRRAGGYPGKELAAKYHAHPGTVSKWIKEARRRGYIKEEEGNA